MRWARLVLSLGLVGGVVVAPGAVTAQAQCEPEPAAVGTIELTGEETGAIEGDNGTVLAVVGYDFEVQRPPRAQKRYGPLTVTKRLDGSSTALAAVLENDEELSRVVLRVHDARGEQLLTYRFGLAAILSQEASAVDGCSVSEIRISVAVVEVVHEPSGASVVDSGQLGGL